MLLEGWSIKDFTPDQDIVESQEELNSLKREQSRKPVFRFSMVEIPIGSNLTFLKDENLVSTVKCDREIEFEGTLSSLNKITLEIFKSKFGINWISVRGPDYWAYENETLNERRMRLEEQTD